ncbi:MAG TPA: DUF2142 domain-containing protein [Anaerolineales bacterium]|nr:DUF2142 domain-containing protein [Anaerolineales bacterium]
MDLKRNAWRQSLPEIFLVIVLLVFGSVMIFMTPLGAGFDEDQHFKRVWQISAFWFIPRDMSARQAKYPTLYSDLSYRAQPLEEPVGFGYWQKYGELSMDAEGHDYGSLSTRANYNPLLYLPQALALRYAGRRFNLPAIWVYYAVRLAGLLAYAFLTWLAVHLIAYGKWVMVILALVPMAVYQASTISADTISNGIGFLFLGGILALEKRKMLSAKDLVWILCLIFALFLTKPNLYPLVLLPFLILPPASFSRRAYYPLLIFFTVALLLLVAVGWLVISPNRGFNPAGSVNALEQIKYILFHPLAFPGILLHSFILGAVNYAAQWIGVYGYNYGSVPGLTYVLFAVGLILCLSVVEPQGPSRRTRVILISVFLLCCLATMLSLYVTFTAVAEDFVYGVQGRYFIPLVPLLFVALYRLPFLDRFRPSGMAASLFALTALLAYTCGLILFYHVTCGASYYTPGLCYDPAYKNFAPLTTSSPSLSEGTVLMQEMVPTCDGMTSVRVRVNSRGEDSAGQLQFTLTHAADNSTLMRTSVANASLPNDDWYTLYFTPDWHSAGGTYDLIISGKDSPPGAGPWLAYSIRPEYPQGTLYENGQASDHDILFQYGCLVGLQKEWQVLFQRGQ